MSLQDIPRKKRVKYFLYLDKKYKENKDELTPQEWWDLDNVHTILIEEHRGEM